MKISKNMKGCKTMLFDFEKEFKKKSSVNFSKKYPKKAINMYLGDSPEWHITGDWPVSSELLIKFINGGQKAIVDHLHDMGHKNADKVDFHFEQRLCFYEPYYNSEIEIEYVTLYVVEK